MFFHNVLFLTIYDDFMLCKVTLGAMKGASKKNEMYYQEEEENEEVEEK